MIKMIKIDRYGKLTIPKKVREELGIKEDQELILISDQEVVIIKKIGAGSTKERFIKLAKEGRGRTYRNTNPNLPAK